MKALVFSDIHIKPDNILYIDLLIVKLKAILSDNRDIDTIIILGDILHSHERLITQCMNKACELIYALRSCIKGSVYIVVGNHDMIDSCQYLSTNHWLNPLKEWDNVVVCDRVVQAFDKKVMFCPYVPKGRFIEAIECAGPDWRDTTKVVFAHQELLGCKYNGKLSVDGDKWPEDYPPIISGHIHLHQHINNNMWYIGSIVQVSFGEGDNCNYAGIVTVDDCGFNIDIVTVNMPRKVTIETNVQDIKKLDIDVSSLNTYRVIIDATSDQFKNFKRSSSYKKLTRQGVKLVHRDIDRNAVKTKRSENIGSFLDVLDKLVKGTGNEHVLKIHRETIK